MASSEVNDDSHQPSQQEENPEPSTSKDSEESDSKSFECNICLDTAKDAVISMCGHLFCWPCLHQWLETRPNQQICPVCKAGISKDKVIPLYGRGSSSQQDPREKQAPPRPQAQRTEPEQRNNMTDTAPERNSLEGAQKGFSFPNFGGGDRGGFQMSFGIGAFPFGFLTSLNLGGNPVHSPAFQVQVEEERFLSNLFLYVAILFIAWLLVA